MDCEWIYTKTWTRSVCSRMCGPETQPVWTPRLTAAEPNATHFTLVSFWGCVCKSYVPIVQITQQQQQQNKNHEYVGTPRSWNSSTTFCRMNTFSRCWIKVPREADECYIRTLIHKMNKYHYPLWQMIFCCWEENIKAICSGSRFGAKLRWGSLFWPILALLFSFAPESVCCAQSEAAALQYVSRGSRYESVEDCLHFLSLCH